VDNERVTAEHISQGSLFSTDFLQESIARVADWQRLTDDEIAALAADLRAIFNQFPTAQTPNESQTEDESKRWQRPLDRMSGRRGEETAPSTQMLRYLRRVDDLTTGKLRWGMLTNGARWRLYYQGARSVSEQFFELDLAAVLAIPGHDGGLFAVREANRRHWLRVFALVFSRDAFLPTPSDQRTFHQRAIDEGKFYEERVAENLSNLVFGTVFPSLPRRLPPLHRSPICRKSGKRP
jgi:hypothetical protein